MNKTLTVGDFQFRFRITMITNFMDDRREQQVIIVATNLQDKSHALPQFSQTVMTGNTEIPWRHNLSLWLEEIQATTDSEKVIKNVQKLVDDPYPLQLLNTVEWKIVKLPNDQRLMVIVEIYQLSLNDYHLRLILSKSVRRDKHVCYLSSPEDWKDKLVTWLVQNHLANSAEDPIITDWVNHLKQAEAETRQKHQGHTQKTSPSQSNVPLIDKLKNLGFAPEDINRLNKLQLFMPDAAMTFLRLVAVALTKMDNPNSRYHYQLLLHLMTHTATEEVKGLQEAIVVGCELLGPPEMKKIVLDTMEEYLAATS
jgi:hypothetical protein